jgi:hypothetical protein
MAPEQADAVVAAVRRSHRGVGVGRHVPVAVERDRSLVVELDRDDGALDAVVKAASSSMPPIQARRLAAKCASRA